MPSKTRTIAALAALSLTVAACGNDERGSAGRDPATRFLAHADGLYIDERAAQERLAHEGLVSGTTRRDGAARVTVLRFRDSRSAAAEAKRLLQEAYQTPLGARSCDLHKETLRVAAFPGATGVVVDTGRTGGPPTKLARIVYSTGRFTFHVSAEAKAGAVPVAQLERAAKRAFVG